MVDYELDAGPRVAMNRAGTARETERPQEAAGGNHALADTRTATAKEQQASLAGREPAAACAAAAAQPGDPTPNPGPGGGRQQGPGQSAAASADVPIAEDKKAGGLMPEALADAGGGAVLERGSKRQRI